MSVFKERLNGQTALTLMETEASPIVGGPTGDWDHRCQPNPPIDVNIFSHEIKDSNDLTQMIVTC